LKHEYPPKKLNNVVFWKESKPNEYVVFSGHYDHLGVGSPEANMIPKILYLQWSQWWCCRYNCNLACWVFQKMNNNERSLFTAFVAEELGGYGSKYFRNK
jgi:hypothetical protein